MSTVNKKAFDRRILHLDLKPALSRTTDEPSRIISITPEPIVNGADIPIITDITLDGTFVSFLAAGGVRGQAYRLVIRFEVASMPGQQIEAIAGLNVG